MSEPQEPTITAEAAAAIRRALAVPAEVPDDALLAFLAVCVDDARAREDEAFQRGYLAAQGYYEVFLIWDGDWRATAACVGFETGELPTDDLVGLLEREVAGLEVGALSVYHRMVGAVRAILEAQVEAEVSHVMAAQDGHPESVVRRAFIVAVSATEVKVYELVAQVDDRQLHHADEIVHRDGRRAQFGAVKNPRQILIGGDQGWTEADPAEYGLIITTRKDKPE